MKNAVSRRYRLGIDVGANSLGWFAVWLNDKDEPIGLGPGGVRIFPDGRDPKSKESNAADRRAARGMRRRRDRYLQRRGNLLGLLTRHGLMPEDRDERRALAALDPYALRADALAEPLPAHHVGRALFHLNQRRGFLSNRKTEKKDKEAGAIKTAAGKLQQGMADASAETLGEFFNRRHAPRAMQARRKAIREELQRLGKQHLTGNARKKAWAKIRKRLFPGEMLPAPLPVRARNVSAGTKAEYDFYPTRQMLEHEFDAVWKAQAPHHRSMTEEAHKEIRHAIFFQRQLKQPPVGKCSLDPAKGKDDVEGFRCSWAHPLAQRFRIWQEVRNLAVVETGQKPPPLSKEDGDKIALALLQNNKLSFDKIRSLLKLPQEAKFNLESEKRPHLLGDETAAKLCHKSLFGKAWRGFPLDRQIEMVIKLEEEQDSEQIITWLEENVGLNRETADRVASAFLPDGHSRLGLRAIKKILPFMEGGMTKTQAEDAAGYKGVHQPDGALSLDGLLPYYGEWLEDDVVGSGNPDDPDEKRWGRFPNPTVHIGLGQLRRVVNALITEYGPPAEITVEMTRDFKLSPKQLAELEKEQAENQKKNEGRADEIRKLGQAVNARNLLKIRLWEEQNQRDPLDRRCPYTGEVISIERLFSEEVDVDHLIPFSDSWDDSAANKIICMRYANREKGNRTPYEAFGKREGAPYDWDAISQRAAALPKSKRWRFDPDARARCDKSGGFQARQLNETGWLARVAKHYLAAVTDPYKIHVLPGKLTAMIRAKWGLNDLLPDHNYSSAKNRKDHRHHAIDSLVAALTDRKLLHRMSSAYDEERQKIEIPLPWPTLRDDLDAKLKAMTISHKPDHGSFGVRKGAQDDTSGQLHEDTAYGTVREPEKEDGGNLVYRKAFRDLKETEIERIRDRRLRKLVEGHVEREKGTGKDFKSALSSFAERKDIPGLPNGIRHVRLTKAEKPEYLVPIRNRSGKAYKAYSAGENAFVDILQSPEGKWIARATTVFQANQKNEKPSWQLDGSGAEPIMRVFKGDMLRIDHEGKNKIVKIVRLSPSNNVLYLVEHNEAGNFQARHDDKDDPFRWTFANFDKLREWNAELVRVDELGRVWRVQPKN
ncbi:MAG TPA: type II CRISPR RNA-guided endonuclease Cas9 [Pseudolabrys sp.]|nr:type II CRISPR RNA-guided endonuclease Cas9 [Pseudolabrys sp.]